MNLTLDTRIDFLFLNLDATRLSLLHAWNRALTALCLVTHTLCHSYCSLPKMQVYLDPFCRVFFKCVHIRICACMFMYARCTSTWEYACMHAWRGQETTSSYIIPQVPSIVSLLRQKPLTESETHWIDWANPRDLPISASPSPRSQINVITSRYRHMGSGDQTQVLVLASKLFTKWSISSRPQWTILYIIYTYMTGLKLCLKFNNCA